MNFRYFFRFLILIVLIPYESFSQSGESTYKNVVINASEKKVSDLLPSFEIRRLIYTDQNSNQQIEAREEGSLKFFILNNGYADIETLDVSIAGSDAVQGIKFENSQQLKSLKAGDSALVTIPLFPGEDIKKGSATFDVLVTENSSKISKRSQISIPVTEPLSIPLFTWITPVAELEKTDFPVYEIRGSVRSGTRITSVNAYVNGMLPKDKNTFTILPTGNPEEYQLKRMLTLDEGYNEIKIEVQNSLGSSVSETRVINYNVQKIDPTYKEKRLALVIGNSNYKSSNTLKNPVNDATAFSAALKGLGFHVLSYFDADQKTMKKAMDEFGILLRDYNVGLFYFAGHGLQVNGINYLIPVDANLLIAQDVDYDCVDVGRLLGKMDEAGTSTNIIILDACRDNPFERSWSGRSESKGSGLAFMNAPSGSIIAYATSPGKTASDGPGKNGLYTSALLQYINIPGQPIEEFFKNVRTMVEARSNKAQTPWESTSLKGNFFFRIK